GSDRDLAANVRDVIIVRENGKCVFIVYVTPETYVLSFY
ncbi:MAG: hypothetical protein ACI92E_003131, partial [Oceanicoccus sp.]